MEQGKLKFYPDLSYSARSYYGVTMFLLKLSDG